MKLTLQMKVLPDTDQKPILLSTMERFNQAASFAAKVGFEAGVSSQPSIHNRCYAEIRQRFGLSAQMAVRAIGKAVEAFAALKAKGRRECPIFKPRGAVTYKANLGGVPVVLVDPRDTSRTCSECGHCETANRNTRDEFECRHCGHSEDADLNAVRNIRSRAWAAHKPPSELATAI